MPAKSCLLSARLRPRVPRSERMSGLAIRMTSVLCSSPSAPMLTSLTIQATLPLHQREYRPENTSSGLAPPISRQSLEECKHLLAAQLLPQNRLLGGIHSVKLKNVLRRVHPNSANLFHGRFPLSEICNDLILARSMPSGAVHSNR